MRALDTSSLTVTKSTGTLLTATLPAESMCRLVYGRLDPDHTPAGVDDGPVLARLRAVFPGA